MAKVEVITAKEKFRPRKTISDKHERVTQMLRLMALSYLTRAKQKRKITDPSEPVFIEIKRKHAAKR